MITDYLGLVAVLVRHSAVAISHILAKKALCCFVWVIEDEITYNEVNHHG